MKFSYTNTARNAVMCALTLAVVLATYSVSSRVVAQRSSEEENRYETMVQKGDQVDSVIKAYNETINKYFNERIKLLVEKMEKEKDPAKVVAIITPPPFDPKNPSVRLPCIGSGSSQDLSTYCLSQITTREYFKFRTAMLRMRERLQNDAPKSLESLSEAKTGPSPVLRDVVQSQKQVSGLQERTALIDTEIETTRTALDLALAAYNEMQMALPLHRKYMDTVKSLESYRDKVSQIRKEVEQYPNTLLDVTTLSCT